MQSHVDSLLGILSKTDKADFVPVAEQLALEQLGHKLPVEDMHPVLMQIRGTGASFADVCATLVDSTYQSRADLRFEHISAALTSSEIGRAMDTALTQMAETRMADHMADVSKLVREMSVPDFRPSNVPLVDTGEFGVSPEGGEVRTIEASVAGENIRIQRDSKNFIISREALLGSERFNLMSAIFDALGQAASRAVARSITDLLAANPVLSDGTAWFDFDAGNLLSTNDITLATVSAAMQALNDMPTISSAGTDTPIKAGVRGRTLLVPPDKLLEARTVVSAATIGDDDPMTVATLPELSSGDSWYLLGSTINAPIAMATLDGAAPLSFNRLDPNDIKGGVDGMPYRCRLEFATAPIDRMIIKTPFL